MQGRYFAIVPAAGLGARFGAGRPKQYQSLAGRPLLEHAVRPLAAHAAIQTVFVALAPSDADFGECRFPQAHAPVLPLYCGGPTRAATVFNALIAMRDRVESDDWVLVHDAARPCLGRSELDTLLREVDSDAIGGLLALAVSDTLKQSDGHHVLGTVPRAGLWRALTPQMFRYELLVEALHRAGSDPTDESAAIEALGLKPRLIPGAATNIKVTYPEDLAVAAAILAHRGERACA
jgi:2-C-methyl-D-erythritol 4-phosphate cytidylyltransferase